MNFLLVPRIHVACAVLANTIDLVCIANLSESGSADFREDLAANQFHSSFEVWISVMRCLS